MSLMLESILYPGKIKQKKIIAINIPDNLANNFDFNIVFIIQILSKLFSGFWLSFIVSTHPFHP